MIAILGMLVTAITVLSCGKIKEEYSRNEVLAEIARLEDQRLVDVGKTAAWTVDPDSVVRRKTAYMIGIVGDTIYEPQLLDLLDDSSRSVLSQAIFAAGQLGDENSTEKLLEYSESQDSLLRALAVEALSKIGSAPASKKLVDILRDSLEAPWLRSLAAESMFRLEDDESKAVLLDLARIDSHEIREKIYYSLLRRADSTMQREFKIGLRDTLEQIQIYSVIGAGQVGDTTAIDRIAPLLQKDNWRLKYHALNAVGRLKLGSLVKAVSNLLDEREHVYVRQAAIRTLGNLGSASVESRLTRLLEDDDGNLATDALLALARTVGSDMLPQADKFKDSDNVYRRVAAAEAYATVGTDDAVASLVAMYDDSLATVRAEVLGLVYGLGRDSLARELTATALDDSDWVPFVVACYHIAEARMTDLVPEVCRRYHRDYGDYDIEVRGSILDVLSEFGDSLMVNEDIRKVVEAGLHEKHFAVRRRASALADSLGLPSNMSARGYASDILGVNYIDWFQRYSENPRALLHTSKGDITIELYYNAAPKTVDNFINLAESGFYDNRVWHRVVPDFVIQDGCPRGDGWGGPGYEIRSEDNDLHYRTGSVGMATSGKDTGGSQYFICQSFQPHLDGRYTLFGQVVNGMRAATMIEVGDSIYSVRIVK